MYKVTNDSKILQYYLKAVNEIDRELEMEVLLNNKQVPTSDILNSIDIEFDYGEGLSVGCIMYGKLETSFISDVVVKENDVIKLAINIKYFDEEIQEAKWLKVPFYQFEVVEVSKTKFSSKVTAYSKGYNELQKLYVTTGETVATAQILNDINKSIPLENMDVMTLSYKFDVGSLGTKTKSEMLQILAQQNGVNIIPSRNGGYKFVVGLGDTEIAYDDSQLISPEIGTNKYELKKVSVDVDSEITYTSGETVAKEYQTLQFANPYFTQNMVDNIYKTFSKYSFYPYESQVYQPQLDIEPLDVVCCGDYEVPLMELKFTIGRDLIMEFCSTVKTEASYNKSYSLSQKMEEAIESNSNLEASVSKLRNEVAYMQENYPTTSDVQDMIESIGGSNEEALETVKEELNKKIDSNTKALESKVSATDVSSIIEQSSDSVRVGFNKISKNFNANDSSFAFNDDSGNKYFVFDSNGMSIYNPTASSTELAKIQVGSDNKVLIATKTASKGISLGYFNSSNTYVEVMLVKDVVNMKDLIAEHNYIALANSSEVEDCIDDRDSLYVIQETPIVNINGKLMIDKTHIPTVGVSGSNINPYEELCTKEGYIDLNKYIFYLHSAIRQLNAQLHGASSISENSDLEARIAKIEEALGIIKE
ncbi:MAG: hypothetical protein [Malazfec virus 1]